LRESEIFLFLFSKYVLWELFVGIILISISEFIMIIIMYINKLKKLMKIDLIYD